MTKVKTWAEYKAQRGFVCTLKGHTQCWIVDIDELVSGGCPSHQTRMEHCEVCGQDIHPECRP